MTFEITEEFSIVGQDKYNWTIVQKRVYKEGENKGGEYEDVQGYFSSLKDAKRRLAERLAKTETNFDQLNIILDKIEKCSE